MPVPLLDLDIPHLEEARIRIDAEASDPAWQSALVIEDFTTFDPTPGAEPLGRTLVRLVSDPTALYVHVTALDPEPERIRARVGRRDTRWADDFVGLYLDPAGEGQRAWLFATNALGAQMDGIRMEASGQDDVTWDGLWASQGRRTAEGYEVELAIPWRTVRHPASCEQLGLMFFRNIPRTGEKSAWPVLDPAVQGILVQEALVGGPGPLPTSAGLDVIGELAFGWTDSGAANHRLGYSGVFPGLTLRYAPGPSTAFGLALNPDFSQVESDGAVIDVNRRHALYYDEKRPFFQEGREWFDHPFGELVYTRSMVSPIVGVRATTEQGDWAVAGIAVLDNDPAPSVSEGGGWSEEDLDGHRAAETVLRARQQVGADGHVGVIATDRSVLGSELSNRVIGVDGRVRLTDQLVVDGSALASSTVISEGEDLVVGPAGSGRIAFNDERFSAGTSLRAVSPGFRAENGFVTTADRIGGGSWAGVTLRPGWSWLPRVSFYPVNTWYGWSTQGDLRDVGWMPNLSLRFGNGAWAWAGYKEAGEVYQGKWLPSRRLVLEAGGAWTSWLEASAGVGTGTAPWYDETAPATGTRHGVWADVTVQPHPMASVSLSGSWERFDLRGETAYAGWVGRARLDLFATPTLSTRWIVDLSTFDGSRSAEGLVAWERSPGRALYLGGRVDPPGQGEDGALAWQVQAKASWTWAR